ncbi:MAG: ATP-binding cassette domain-containing protein [Clostridia bacterium]|nr:ATP-binding cassette domain-containing protein [Clostridia bacterium]
MIELKNITKKFNESTVNETTIFNDFNFTVKKGEFVSVVGSNGSGKTTLLNLIAGTYLPTSGSIILDGTDITKQKEFVRARRMSRVFQDPFKGVASNMTIAENLSLAENKGRLYGLSKGVSKSKTEYYKELVSSIGLGLEDKMNIPMGTLSGGQRQAVSLIMATMTPIDILILDEHTAALDPHTADTIMEITDKIVKEKNLTTIMVTHNLRYATEYGNRLVMMDKGNIIMDKSGEEKQKTKTDDILSVFVEISVECGN